NGGPLPFCLHCLTRRGFVTFIPRIHPGGRSHVSRHSAPAFVPCPRGGVPPPRFSPRGRPPRPGDQGGQPPRPRQNPIPGGPNPWRTLDRCVGLGQGIHAQTRRGGLGQTCRGTRHRPRRPRGRLRRGRRPRRGPRLVDPPLLGRQGRAAAQRRPPGLAGVR